MNGNVVHVRHDADADIVADVACSGCSLRVFERGENLLQNGIFSFKPIVTEIVLQS